MASGGRERVVGEHRGAKAYIYFYIYRGEYYANLKEILRRGGRVVGGGRRRSVVGREHVEECCRVGGGEYCGKGGGFMEEGPVMGRNMEVKSLEALDALDFYYFVYLNDTIFFSIIILYYLYFYCY